MGAGSRTLAVLGPTNTGKTSYAIERMLAHETGVIGLPLRLLAREVYDRIVALRGPSAVALVTGEERIVPDRARYRVCTVEAMPERSGADFVAVDEIQLCTDPDRGHVFTDRLLRMRGARETQFLGSATMRGVIRELVPEAEFRSRERMSRLSHAGRRRMARMPPRSAVVGFSVQSVYEIAELLRRRKGGAAVVMGALSPRTRNAQVELYQNGEVDYLVATDAIGMGLNLDVRHVAFSALEKFDGRRMRALEPDEIGQIAGRAGRGESHGTFGVTGTAPELHPALARAVAEHRYAPVAALQWRNSDLDYSGTRPLLASLERHSEDPRLIRARASDDLQALMDLAGAEEVAGRATGEAAVRLLWDVCRIPDFRKTGRGEHCALLERVFVCIHDSGALPDGWMAAQIRRIDREDGGIEALSMRLAFVRTLTYLTQRRGWVENESHWREVARAVEDRLSDALHAALIQRFVDRRTSALMRRLGQKEAPLAQLGDSGEIMVEGERLGRVEGFRFVPDASGAEASALRQASAKVVAPRLALEAERFRKAPNSELAITPGGELAWRGCTVGALVAGDDPLRPGIRESVDDSAGPDAAQAVRARLQSFVDSQIAELLAPLLGVQRDESLLGGARGLGYRLAESLGVLKRAEAAAEIGALDQEARAGLRRHGVRFGQHTVFFPALLKPAPTALRLVLWAVFAGRGEFPDPPPPGLVTVPAGDARDASPEAWRLRGYRLAGERAIRVDMLERLADLLREQDGAGGFEATADMLSITGLTLEQFADLMVGLGYAAARGERAKPASAPDAPAAQADAAPSSAPAADGDAGAADAGAAAAAEPIAVSSGTAGDPAVAAGVAEPIAAFSKTAAADPAVAAAVAAESIAESSGTIAGESAAAAGDANREESEVFYIFTRPRSGAGRDRARGRTDPRSGAAKGKRPEKGPGKGKRKAAARPRPAGKPKIDPSNPFASALKDLRDRM